MDTPVDDATVHRVGRVLTSYRAFRVITGSNRFVRCLRHFHVSFDCDSSMRKDVSVSVLDVSVAGTYARIIIICGQGAFRLRAHDVRLDRVVKAACDCVCFVFVLGRALAGIARLNIILDLMGVASRVHVLVKYVGNGSYIVDSPAALVRGVGAHLQRYRLQPTIVREVIVIIAAEYRENARDGRTRRARWWASCFRGRDYCYLWLIFIIRG